MEPTDPRTSTGLAVPRGARSAASADRPGVVAALVAAALLGLGIALRSNVLIAFIALFCVFTPLEKLFALRPQKVFRRGFGTDVVHFAVTNVLIGVVFVVLLIPAIILVRHGGVLPTAPFIHAQPLWAQIVEAQLLGELTHYWAHRATHRIGVLWRFHKMHHSIQQLDWLASARQHPLDGAITRGLGDRCFPSDADPVSKMMATDHEPRPDSTSWCFR